MAVVVLHEAVGGVQVAVKRVAIALALRHIAVHLIALDGRAVAVDWPDSVRIGVVVGRAARVGASGPTTRVVDEIVEDLGTAGVAHHDAVRAQAGHLVARDGDAGAARRDGPILRQTAHPDACPIDVPHIIVRNADPTVDARAREPAVDVHGNPSVDAVVAPQVAIHVVHGVGGDGDAVQGAAGVVVGQDAVPVPCTPTAVGDLEILDSHVLIIVQVHRGRADPAPGEDRVG